MFILIDVILVAVLVICMIIGWVKGFIDEVLRLLSGLLAFFIALFLTPHIAPVLNDHLFYGRISGYMSEQMDEIDRREAAGEILVIRPPESLGIRRTEHDPEELERVYQLGRRTARRMLPAIRSFLQIEDGRREAE